MKRTNTVPSPGAKKVNQATSNDTTPKGRYKSVIFPSRHGASPSNSKLPAGYLRTFGLASTRSSSLPEASKHTDDSNPRTEISNDDASSIWSLECNSLPPPPTTPPPPPPPLAEATNSSKEENYLVLSESQLNVLSLNLSEIADKVSPTKYDPVIEIDEETLEVFIGENIENSSETFVSSSEQSMRFKTPYSRQRRDSKSYVSKQKSFTRRRSGSGRRGSYQELNNSGDVSHDVNSVLNFSAGNFEAFKLDSESDSGYSSSMSTSVSLGEEIDAAKKLSTSTDIDADDLTFVGDDRGGKSSASDLVMSKSTSGSLEHQNTGNVEGQLDSLINGVSSEIGNLDLTKQVREETVVYREEPNLSNGLEEPSTSFILSHNENVTPTFHEQENGLEKSSFNFQKDPLDGSALQSRTKTGKRPMLQRRRTTTMSFRPPKQVTVQEGESGIVEMDEAGFLQLLTDFKSLKTQLLKLKRELQEADVVSPLMHSHSGVPRRGSFSSDTDTNNKIPLHRKRMLQRTMTMDSVTMRERLHRTSSSSSSGGRSGSLSEITGSLSEITETPSESARVPKPSAGNEEEIKNLHQELEEVKEKLTEITEERNSLIIAREELEHELDSKNHTIRMLQKQLESQTDSQDEMAYLKRQVKSLTNQIQQQQQKITELRYRATSPGAVPMGAISTSFQHKKEAVKADIRNRLRDAFVKHLGESSKSNVQLSKYIQRAEQNISMAQKGLSSLYSSPHASTEHLPKDKSFQRSDSQSSVERNQEDSDGRESESDSSRCSRRRIASSRANRNNDDSGSESGKSIRSRPESPRTFKSQDESDGRASDSDTGNSRSRRITSFENSAEKNKRKDSEPELVKTEGQSEDSLSVNKPPRVRKLSRNKLMNKIEASPLSHSWTPGAIEKIVKSWRETKSPVSQEKSKEEEKALKPVSHVQFF